MGGSGRGRETASNSCAPWPAGISFQLANQLIFIKNTVQDSGELLRKFHPEKYEVEIKTFLYPIAHLAYRRGR